MSDERWSRQILFPPIGRAGQEKIGRARVVVVGCGALGTVAAELLVRAGVRTLTIIDRDVVELSNLQRQSLFTDEDARSATEKAVAAARALRAIDPGVDVRPLVKDLSPRNAERLLSGHDVIVDATDNFAARFLLNDVAWKSGIPWVYGAAVAAEGSVGVFRPGVTPCLRCLLGELPPPGTTPTCDTAGVLGPVTHLVASLEALEALKLITGAEPTKGIASISLWESGWPVVRMALVGAEPVRDCPTCALGSYPALAGEGSDFARSLCGRDSVQLVPETPRPVDLAATAERLRAHGAETVAVTVTQGAESLTAVFPDATITLFADGRAIVKGTLDPVRGRSLFARYVGA